MNKLKEKLFAETYRCFKICEPYLGTVDVSPVIDEYTTYWVLYGFILENDLRKQFHKYVNKIEEKTNNAQQSALVE